MYDWNDIIPKYEYTSTLCTKQARDHVSSAKKLQKMFSEIHTRVDQADIICCEENGQCVDACPFEMVSGSCRLHQLKSLMDMK